MRLLCRAILLAGASGAIPACKNGGVFGFGGSGTSAPTMIIASPITGDVWGGTRTVTWTFTDPGISSIRIDFTGGSGLPWTTLVPSIGNTGAYVWDTSLQTDSATCSLRVTALDGMGAMIGEATCAGFTLDNTLPAVAVTAPVGGDVWSGTRTITWITTDAHPGTVAIDISTNSGSSWTSLKTGVADVGSFRWDSMFQPGGPTCRIRVTATDLAGNAAAPAFSADFTLDNSARIVDQSQPVTDPAAGAWGVGGSSPQELAQVVTAGMSGALVQVRIPILAHVAGDAIVEIQGVSGGVPNGVVLASQILPWASVPAPGSDAFTALDFTAPVSFSAGDVFAIVVRGNALLLYGSDFAVAAGPVGNPYAGGQGYWTLASPAWSLMGTRTDLPFKTIVVP